MIRLPGSVIEIDEGRILYGFANLSPLFSATKGLTLSQVCEIAGAETTTVQNWVKRGWVAHPIDKRYHEQHLARILILNMLKSEFQLEKIGVLLRYINGSPDDRNDDTLPDSDFYTYLCVVIDSVLRQNLTEIPDIRAAVRLQIAAFREPYAGAKEKLETVLTIMTLTYFASTIREKALSMFGDL